MYIFTLEYLAIKKNEALVHGTTWVNLKNLLSEISQKQNATCWMIPFIRNVQNR